MKYKTFNKLDKLTKFIDDRNVLVKFITQGNYNYTLFYKERKTKTKL